MPYYKKILISCNVARAHLYIIRIIQMRYTITDQLRQKVYSHYSRNKRSEYSALTAPFDVTFIFISLPLIRFIMF